MKIGYARVSTEDQHPEAQADRLTEAGCARVFTDKGESGRKASRPQWDKCLEHLREGDTLVVVRLDRMGRSVRNLIEVVAGLEARRVNLSVLDQGIDTSTPTGRFTFHVLSALAEMEADLIRERTLDGLAAARARGRKGGRKPKLTGRQAAIVRQMYEGRQYTLAAIAETFGVSETTVYRSLRKPAAAAS